jgi:cytochrome c-type biogenesis protein CcmH/NrfG
LVGALYANNGGLEKAVGDFEAALQINPQHQNAKKYLCETLIAVARNYEDDSKVREDT